MKMGFRKLAAITAIFTSIFAQQVTAAENALQFNGTTDRIEIPNSQLPDINHFSIAAWIKPTAVTSPRAMIVMHGQHSISSENWSMHLVGSKLTVGLGPGNSATTIYTGNIDIEINKWSHVAMTFSFGTLTLYVNGIEDVTTTAISPISKETVTQIGGDGKNGTSENNRHMFSGTIDELSIWNKALDTSEIGRIKNETFIKDGLKVKGSRTHAQIGTLVWADLFAYYPMNEGSGKILQISVMLAF